MANTSRPELELQSMQHEREEGKGLIFYPRAVAPTAAQVSLSYLVYNVFYWLLVLIIFISASVGSKDTNCFVYMIMLLQFPRIGKLYFHANPNHFPCILYIQYLTQVNI